MANLAKYQLIALVLLFQFHQQLIVDLLVVFEIVCIPEVNRKIEHQKDLANTENVIVDINLESSNHVNSGKVSNIT